MQINYGKVETAEAFNGVQIHDWAITIVTFNLQYKKLTH